MSDTVRPGEVTITLDGDPVTLVPSARALLTLSRKHGGLVGLSRGLEALDADAFVNVIAAGMAQITQEQIEALPELVFRAGMVKLSTHLSTYLANLANGGVPPAAEAPKGKSSGNS